MRRGRPLCGRQDVVDELSVIEHIGTPFTLTPGHPMRRQRCIICAMMIGGRECCTVITVDLRGAGCTCGGVPSCTFLMCRDHADDPNLNIGEPSLARHYQHHLRGRA